MASRSLKSIAVMVLFVAVLKADGILQPNIDQIRLVTSNTQDVYLTACKTAIYYLGTWDIPQILYRSQAVSTCQLTTYLLVKEFRFKMTLFHTSIPTADRKCLLTISFKESDSARPVNTKAANDCMNLGLYIPPVFGDIN